jgi:hypothetical protein
MDSANAKDNVAKPISRNEINEKFMPLSLECEALECLAAKL